MDLPLGYKVNSSTANLVCKLVKSIYGLRQASRKWNAELSSFLLAYGFSQSLADYSMFIHSQGTSLTIVVVYVNDIIVTSNNVSFI